MLRFSRLCFRVLYLGGFLLGLSAGLSGCATQGTTTQMLNAVREAPDNYVVVAVNNDPSHYLRAGSTTRRYGNNANYLESANARHTLQTLATEYQLQQVSGWPIPMLSLHCVIFRTTNPTSREALLDKLQHDTRVYLAQPLQSFVTNSQEPAQYNDPYAPMQNNLTQMGILAAHRWSHGNDVRIALVDTGVDITHPELRERIAVTRNFVDHNEQQFITDRHGTAIAGIIAANANNSLGIVGVAPEAKLYALKACWQLKPDHDAAVCNSFTLAQALSAAIELHAQIINLSLVGPPDPLLGMLIARAMQAGIIVIGADGGAESNFPAHVNNVIGVASIEDGIASHDTNVALAPGRDVMTLMPGNRYDFSSGNSVATAEVTGAVALLLAASPHASQAEFEQLRRSLLQMPTPGKIAASVNACAVMAQFVKQIFCSDAITHAGTDADRRKTLRAQ